MRLSDYCNLIKNLPYLQQAFTTKKETWRTACRQSRDFRQFCDSHFEGETHKLSRHDVFSAAKRDFHSGLYSTILWGYSRNMRGNNLHTILSSVTGIKAALSGNRELSAVDFKVMCESLENKRVGLSTLSKLLYFFKFTLEGNKCLILDSRILTVLNTDIFQEFYELRNISEYNKKNLYSKYLEMVREISGKGNYQEDQLELFLFQFGNNLKPTQNRCH
jgi:hypothetical protein